jgi:hypothetical protein
VGVPTISKWGKEIKSHKEILLFCDSGINLKLWNITENHNFFDIPKLQQNQVSQILVYRQQQHTKTNIYNINMGASQNHFFFF